MNATTRVIETYAELETYDWKVPVPGAYPHIARPDNNAPRAEFLAYQKKVDERFEHYMTTFQAYHNISLQGVAEAKFELVQRIFFLIND